MQGMVTRPGGGLSGNSSASSASDQQNKPQPCGRRFQQKWHEDRELPETHAVLAQHPARVLIQPFTSAQHRGGQ